MKKMCLLIALIMICLPITSLAANNEANITRGEFVKELLMNSKIDVQDVTESTFSDVVDPEYISYIEAAYNKGITSGYGELFKPQREITKEEAIVMIVRVFGEGFSPEKFSQESIEALLDFSDNTSISQWARPYIAYGLEKGLIKETGRSFYSQKPLSRKEASSLIENARATYIELFTRDGLSASEVLTLANDKNNEYDTYKQKGSLNMNIQMEVSGVSQEELQEDLNPMSQNMVMDLDLEAQVQTPDKAYIKEIIKSGIPEAKDQEIEIFMDGTVMYTKMLGSDKWVKQDMGNILAQIQSLSNNEPYKMSQLSNQQLEFFKNYAQFEEDVRIDKEDYYIVAIDLDKDAYREFFMETIEKTMDSIVDLQVNNPELNRDPSFNEEQYKQMMMQIINQMEAEVEYKFYINKDTMNYEKMYIAQKVYMTMENLNPPVEEGIEESQNITIKMVNQMEGEIDYYDFNEEVTFPVINPEDIMDNQQPMEVPQGQ